MKKKLILLAGVCSLMDTALASESPVSYTTTALTVSVDWVKTATGTWESQLDGKKTFYKINATDGSLWSSSDNLKWEQVKGGTWQDKNGKFLKIENNELKSSADGKIWAVVSDSQWQSTNGTWYKFDKAMILWAKAGKM